MFPLTICSLEYCSGCLVRIGEWMKAKVIELWKICSILNIWSHKLSRIYAVSCKLWSLGASVLKIIAV